MRRLVLALLLAAAVTAAAGVVGGGGSHAVPAYAFGSGRQGAQVVQQLGQDPSGFSGGPVTAADGETVSVFVEDALLAADPTLAQHWADVLAGLVHGPELADVSLYLASLDRVHTVCGPSSLGCYGRDRIVAVGQDIAGIPTQAIITHEYGHHVANNRANDPWDAVDWGTKRWASYLNVCRRVQNGELYPGDETQYYKLNPGEAFAEDYRVLNERLAGLPEVPWTVVDPKLYPDQTALDLLSHDVTDPWTANTTTTYPGTLRATTSGRGFRFTTALDGMFSATLTSGGTMRLTLRIVDLATKRFLAVDSSAARTKTLSVSLCGQRSIQVQVKRVSGAGSFTLSVSRP